MTPSVSQEPRNRLRHLLSPHHWKRRLLMWGAAATVGVAAVAFAKFADLAMLALKWLIARSPLWPCVTAPLGFAAIAWATRRFFRGAEGSGIPQTIYALRVDSGRAGEALLRPRVVVGRVLLAGAVLLCGGSIGREGPTVHVGAVIINAFGRFMPARRAAIERHTLVLAGGAAGVAAAFNTPLAGIVFAIEELSRSFEERASGTALVAVVVAGVVAIALVGDYTYFGQPSVTGGASINASGLLLALICGLGGGGFSLLTLRTIERLPGSLDRWRRQHPVGFAALCGLGVAALGLASGSLTYGTGYAEARAILESNAHLTGLYAPARALATWLSFLSGVPAGLLAPSLSVGAGLGQFLADHLGQSSAVPFAVLGMCGFLAGVTQAPLTSFVIVMEMTAGHTLVLPLMVTAAVSTAVSRLLSRPLYQALADRYARSIPAEPMPSSCKDASQHRAPDSGASRQ